MKGMVKLPPNVDFRSDIHLLVWRPLGVVTEAVVNRILAYLAEMEARDGEPFNRFTDTSAQEAVELTFQYVFHVALYRRLSYMGRPPVKSAIFATDPKVIQMVKIHVLMSDHSPLQVAHFEKREEAAQWLGVPIDALSIG
jgi:hypothetical protein